MRVCACLFVCACVYVCVCMRMCVACARLCAFVRYENETRVRQDGESGRGIRKIDGGRTDRAVCSERGRWFERERYIYIYIFIYIYIYTCVYIYIYIYI